MTAPAAAHETVRWNVGVHSAVEVLEVFNYPFSEMPVPYKKFPSSPAGNFVWTSTPTGVCTSLSIDLKPAHVPGRINFVLSGLRERGLIAANYSPSEDTIIFDPTSGVFTIPYREISQGGVKNVRSAIGVASALSRIFKGEELTWSVARDGEHVGAILGEVVPRDQQPFYVGKEIKDIEELERAVSQYDTVPRIESVFYDLKRAFCLKLSPSECMPTLVAGVNTCGSAGTPKFCVYASIHPHLLFPSSKLELLAAHIEQGHKTVAWGDMLVPLLREILAAKLSHQGLTLQSLDDQGNVIQDPLPIAARYPTARNPECVPLDITVGSAKVGHAVREILNRNGVAAEGIPWHRATVPGERPVVRILDINTDPFKKMILEHVESVVASAPARVIRRKIPH